VDLRTRTAFAAGHVAGTLNLGVDDSLATYLGWLIPWGTPVTLLGDTPQQVAGAQRELVRIGIDRPAAAATGDPAGWAGGRPLRSFPVADFAALAAVRRQRPVVVLDVRRNLEWTTSRIDGAIHIPLHELPDRLGEVPDGEVWVHCRSGKRASIASAGSEVTTGWPARRAPVRCGMASREKVMRDLPKLVPRLRPLRHHLEGLCAARPSTAW
jgi:rhodanese-related sulfurtransferase